ncbi:BppU family phage baseplate upper protein [Lactococcus raffinolactis]|uniref:BppU family phage baseplate upper protein n=1 Tax=Pseudolactococcus raffinolactis TaxID=1366 RepID=UPI001436C8F9|nr:BppU family phage baseplate upper protein [Lactococcus raffinolactis]QIW60385.1 BppU family phage baseplate upper protein [Lactococcus raffinolactis]
MAKWKGILSTTEPFNYIGILKVRYGNINHETCQFTISENGQPVNLLGHEIYFQAILNGNPVEEQAKIIDGKNGLVEFTFSNHSMQAFGKQIGYFQFRRGTQVVGTTQDFSYFVINAVGNTEIDTGAYWQSLQDLLNDMNNFISHNQGDFTLWFDSVKDILYGIDPGGQILQELIEARRSITGNVLGSLKDRLEYDFQYTLDEISRFYSMLAENNNLPKTIQDNAFSVNHTVVVVDEVTVPYKRDGLVIATIGTDESSRFIIKKIGDFNG